MKQFMPDVSPGERLTILQQNADTVEETTYQKPLTEEALADKKDILTENSIKLFDLEEEKKEAVKVFKDQIDPLRKENKELLGEIRTGQQTVKGTIYHMANHEEGMMETYDNDGYMIASRRLKPSEKQGNLLRKAQ